MAIEIVDFPINSMVIFQFAMLVHQRVLCPSFSGDWKFWVFVMGCNNFVTYHSWFDAWDFVPKASGLSR